MKKSVGRRKRLPHQRLAQIILDTRNPENGLPRQHALAEIAAFAERLKILYRGLTARCDRRDVIGVENDI